MFALSALCPPDPSRQPRRSCAGIKPRPPVIPNMPHLSDTLVNNIVQLKAIRQFTFRSVHTGQSFQETPADETNDAFSMGKAGAPVLTINEKAKEYVRSKWCYDTPGVVQPEQTLNLLTTEELLLVIPKQMIKPRTFKLEPGMSLFLAGMGRLDYLRGPGDSIRVTVFASGRLPVVIVRTDSAEKIYGELLGSELLAVPVGDAERLARWPELVGKAMRVLGIGERVAACGKSRLFLIRIHMKIVFDSQIYYSRRPAGSASTSPTAKWPTSRCGHRKDEASSSEHQH